MKVGPNTIAVIDYELFDEGGELIESSSGETPFTFSFGAGDVIPGLEKELEGMEPGQSKKIVVAPEEAYGMKDPNLVQQVPRANFPDGFPLETGVSYLAKTDTGATVNFQVLGFDDQNVEIDLNHPLAGMTLHFAVEIREVRGAGD